jgi:hypothetical protein
VGEAIEALIIDNDPIEATITSDRVVEADVIENLPVEATIMESI